MLGVAGVVNKFHLVIICLRSGFVFALELSWFAGFAVGLLQRWATGSHPCPSGFILVVLLVLC